MKALDLFKKDIGKTAAINEKDIPVEEKFQQVFIPTEELLERVPSIIKKIYLSNITHRVFSIPFYTAIDETTSSLFKEKIETEVKEYTVSNTQITYANVDNTLVERSRGVGVDVYNNSSTSSCDVHIRPYNVDSDLYFFTVNPEKHFYFQFEYFFRTLSIGLKQQTASDNVRVRLSFIPL